MQQLIKDIAATIKAGTALPKMPSNLGIEQAYALQKAVVQEVCRGALAGIKAGMTAPAMQNQFGLSSAIVACLYESGRLARGATIESAPGILIECELGLVVDAAGTPKSCGPVIELPRLNFAHSEDQTGANLIACNIAADRFIVGEQLPMRNSYEAIQVRLQCDGEVLSSAPATDAMGGPYEALAWMLDESRKWGLPLEDDMLCITGACGGAHPAKPGHYLVDYGELGSIEFRIT